VIKNTQTQDKKPSNWSALN